MAFYNNLAAVPTIVLFCQVIMSFLKKHYLCLTDCSVNELEASEKRVLRDFTVLMSSL